MDDYAARYPNLEHMISCYFYQNYDTEYKSIPEAIAAYRDETGTDIRIKTSDEIGVLLRSEDNLRLVIDRLGGGNVKVDDLKSWLLEVSKVIRR